MFSSKTNALTQKVNMSSVWSDFHIFEPSTLTRCIPVTQIIRNEYQQPVTRKKKSGMSRNAKPSASLLKTLSVAQGLADSPNFSSSKNPRTFSQSININE